jgi:predicted transcriptional regulator
VESLDRSGTVSAECAVKLTAEILVAYLSGNPVPAACVASLARDLRVALELPLSSLGVGSAAVDGPEHSKIASAKESEDATPARVALRVDNSKPTPAVPVADSVHDEFLVSLEDGKHYVSLRRHLMAKYKMTPAEYRAKWGLPADYPMVAPSYARQRAEVAKRIGLGKTGRSAVSITKGRAAARR